jgi:hypothetical protein
VTRIPSPSRRLLAVVAAAPFIVAACSTADTEEPTDASVESGAASVTAAPAQDTASTTEETPAEAATWLDIELADAVTGETFTLASLAGEVVAIEPMAIWCTNCKRQQDNVKAAYPEIESAGVTYISLGIDPGENPDALARYADRNGYGWTFSQSSTEFSRALSDLFGPQVLSAPSTPLIVLDPSGEVAVQEFGFHDPEKLVGILEEASA